VISVNFIQRIFVSKDSVCRQGLTTKVLNHGWNISSIYHMISYPLAIISIAIALIKKESSASTHSKIQCSNRYLSIIDCSDLNIGLVLKVVVYPRRELFLWSCIKV
jgi:hypothetical protein